jgi:hypothetical protein
MYFSGQADLVPQELCFFTFYLILLRVMEKKRQIILDICVNQLASSP